MKKVLQKVRDLDDDRKVVLANVMAGIVTLTVLVFWAVSFAEKIDATPATAAGSQQQEEVGALGGLFDQVKTLVSEIKSIKTPEPVDIALPAETDFDPAP